jgi:hypothetical protein
MKRITSSDDDELFLSSTDVGIKGSAPLTALTTVNVILFLNLPNSEFMYVSKVAGDV